MGELLPAVPTTPNNVTDSWQPLVDSNVMSSYGMNVVTLTNWDATTTRPEIAQGSVIEIDGSLAVFTVTEDLGNTNPPDGNVYVKFTVTGTSVEARLTGTIPSWNATLGGWYNGSGERYSGHLMTKNGTAYTLKRRWRDESDGEYIALSANRGATIPTIDVTTINATTGNITTVNAVGGVKTDNIHIRSKYFSGSLDASGDVTFAHGITNAVNRYVGNYGTINNPVAPDNWGSYQTVSLDATNVFLTSTANNGLYRCVIHYSETAL